MIKVISFHMSYSIDIVDYIVWFMSLSDQDACPYLTQYARNTPVPSLTKIPNRENHMTPSHLSTKTAYHNEVDPSLPSYEDAMALSTSLHI